MAPASSGVTLDWVDWFNNRCLLGPIPPAEAEANHYAASEKPRYDCMAQTKLVPRNPVRFTELRFLTNQINDPRHGRGWTLFTLLDRRH